jgi:hypothetical protein
MIQLTGEETKGPYTVRQQESKNKVHCQALPVKPGQAKIVSHHYSEKSMALEFIKLKYYLLCGFGKLSCYFIL